MNVSPKSLDAEINDYLLAASGHLKESKTYIDGRQVAAFGAAVSSGLVMMSQAEAAVVVNGGDTPPFSVVDGVGTVNRTSYGFRQFDMDGDGNNDFAIWAYSASYNGNNGVAAAYGPFSGSNQEFGGGSDDLPKLASGFTLGPSIPSGSWTSSVMSTGNDVVFGPGSGAGAGWTGGVNETGFVGVRFRNASGMHYGWIRLQSNPTTGTITVLQYAYESCPNTAISVGATTGGAVCAAPVPKSIPVMGPLAYGLTSLALGGLGLGSLRRRRSARKDEASRH
jgi:hypothetical protein